MDQVILDRKTWDFPIRINLTQIKMFEKLGPGQKGEIHHHRHQLITQ